MEFDRGKAKQAITQTDQSDEEYVQTMSEAEAAKLEILRLNQAHEINKINAERGWVGRIFGSWRNVPMFIALICVISGIACFFYFMTLAGDAGSDKKFWLDPAKTALAFAGAALGYIFGRGANPD